MCAQRFVDTIAQTICEGVASPVSLGVYLRLKYGCYDELSMMEVRPEHYSSPSSYYADCVVVSLLRKDQSLPTTHDRRKAAVANFWKAEKQCFRTNVRLAPYLEGFSHPDYDTAIARFLRVVRKNVRRLIGDAPPEMVNGRFGPGSTFGDKGRLATLPDKMQSRPTVTNSGTRWLQEWSTTAWGKACAAANRDEVIVPGNRFLTVPKDCRKDRGIAVEPSINVFYQLAMGRGLRRRLRCQGLDLDYAQDDHRRVACEASKEGHMATIDLSNASDTVCSTLVKLLLPSLWYEELVSLRSEKTLVEGQWVRLEKFSSMGNGYTFELETVVFASIAGAVMEFQGVIPEYGIDVLTFGDDIIVPTQFALDVLAALSFLGFEANVDKTFVDGPFKESCGGDFFMGADVRPHFVKTEIAEPQHYIALANALWKLREKATTAGLYAALTKARFKVLDSLPSHIRALTGPEELGDVVIWDLPTTWRPRILRSIRYFSTYSPVQGDSVKWKYFDGDVVLATALYLAGSRADSGEQTFDGVQPRDNVSGYKIRQVAWS